VISLPKRKKYWKREKKKVNKTKRGKKIIIYTDGSCDPNPGPGGWAALIIADDEEELLSGYDPQSTNNRMELMAAIQALKKIRNEEEIILYTDSQYVKKGITEWMDNWISRNWKRKGGVLANVDLWKELAKETNKHEIEWRWVKAHNGHHYNERVDRKARQMANSGRKKR
jgi:ribonuclease HI